LVPVFGLPGFLIAGTGFRCSTLQLKLTNTTHLRTLLAEPSGCQARQ
jgi:hypothetical protein